MISLIAVLNNRALDFKVPKNKADLVLSMFQNGVEQWGPLPHVSGLVLNYFVYEQSFASKIFFTSKRRNLTSNFSMQPFSL